MGCILPSGGLPRQPQAVRQPFRSPGDSNRVEADGQLQDCRPRVVRQNPCSVQRHFGLHIAVECEDVFAGRGHV